MDELQGRGPLSELLDHVNDNLLEMMSLVSVRLERVTTALIAGDVAEADLIIASDDEVDLVALDTEELCLQTLATQQPVASDLRAIVAAMHIVPAAERAGDLVVNIAKATGRLQGVHLDERTKKLILGMSAQGRILFDRCADALRDRDAELAISVDQLDDVLDDLHGQFVDTVLRGGNHGDLLQQQSTQLAMIGRFYERIGDHAENIGERIHYAITGYRAERAAAERARARRDNPDPDAPVIRSRGLAVVDSVAEERRIDAIRRDFVANVSHELKTPVAALSLLVESLKDEVEGDVRTKLLNHAERETGRLDSIIDDLIELARLEDDSATATRIVAVDELVASSVDAASALAERRGIALSVTGVPSHAELHADKRQVVRALTSLIDNAVKYSDEGGAVNVGVEILPDSVLFAVHDDGIGIARPELERIFERFYRVDRARSRDTGGTGLGLAIVRHVADNHAGRVLVESKPGEGSTFTLSLPLNGAK